MAEELAQLNQIIATTLRSDTGLMNSIVTQYLQTKGKQLRPLLVLLSGKLFGEINERVLYAGAAIEMLHNASLIHDDVIDQATEHRGVETINSVWTNHVAVLVGDFFVTGALRCAVKAGQVLDNVFEACETIDAFKLIFKYIIDRTFELRAVAINFSTTKCYSVIL